jgi:hypothetical protein
MFLVLAMLFVALSTTAQTARPIKFDAVPQTSRHYTPPPCPIEKSNAKYREQNRKACPVYRDTVTLEVFYVKSGDPCDVKNRVPVVYSAKNQ